MKILKYPHPVLRKKCATVKKIDQTARQESDVLRQALKSIDSPAKLVNGLAANQIGILKRIVVLKKPFNAFVTMVNPNMKKSFCFFPSIEFCASLPGMIRLKLRRLIVTVEYKDLEGETRRLRLYGFTAFTMQQEMDHLNGILIID